MDWFLYDIGLRHERVKKNFSKHIFIFTEIVEGGFTDTSVMMIEMSKQVNISETRQLLKS